MHNSNHTLDRKYFLSGIRIWDNSPTISNRQIFYVNHLENPEVHSGAVDLMFVHISDVGEASVF